MSDKIVILEIASLQGTRYQATGYVRGEFVRSPRSADKDAAKEWIRENYPTADMEPNALGEYVIR